jgi:hypothetical protein
MLKIRWSTVVAPKSNLSPPPIPFQRLNHLKRSLRRRVEDGVEDIFRVACITGDLATAEALLGVLEDMYQRRQLRVGSQHRINDDGLAMTREEFLLRRQAADQGRL